jgi:hypothetical protein
MMMCLLWRYDCTILMTCNDKSDVLYFLMSSFCQRSVYSLSYWVCVFLPGYFVRDSEWRREIIPISVYLSCPTRSSFSLAISMIYVSCWYWYFGSAESLVVFFFFLGFLSIWLISLSFLPSIDLDAFSCFCCLVGFDTPRAVWARSQLSTLYASLRGFQRVAFVDLI